MSIARIAKFLKITGSLNGSDAESSRWMSLPSDSAARRARGIASAPGAGLLMEDRGRLGERSAGMVVRSR